MKHICSMSMNINLWCVAVASRLVCNFCVAPRKSSWRESPGLCILLCWLLSCVWFMIFSNSQDSQTLCSRFVFNQVIHVLYRCASVLWCTLFHTFQVLPELDEAKRKHLAELFVLRTDTCRTKLRSSKEALVSVISSHVRVTTTFLVAAIRTSWIDFDWTF